MPDHWQQQQQQWLLQELPLLRLLVLVLARHHWHCQRPRHWQQQQQQLPHL
jgi:hypothetical protein